MSTRPNVLFILSDQHNAKVLGHVGHPDVKTPHLDRMAAEGVRCANAITQNPICTPSRMCFISGQYAHNHGYYGLSGPNPGGLPTVFGYFRSHGYFTAAIGKIHCPDNWVEDDCDVFHETCAPSSRGISTDYERMLADGGHQDDHSRYPEFDAKTGRQSMDARPSWNPYEASQEGWIAAESIRCMQRAHDEGRPFFIHASLPRPHQVTAPSQPFWDWYQTDEITLPPNADHDGTGKAPHFQRQQRRWRERDWALFEPTDFEHARRRKLHGYLGAVSQVDQAVGDLLGYLRDNGLMEHTIVVYSSDHGDYAAEFGIMEKAPGICADAITRIPMLWWGGPVGNAGRVIDGLVETVDLLPTVTALCGLPHPWTADGDDIRPLLTGERSDGKRVAVTEFARSKSIRKGPWRLVHYPRGMFTEHPDGFDELYHVVDDPWEQTNRADDPACAEIIADLKAELMDWLVNTTRPATTLGCSPVEDPQQLRHRLKTDVLADGKISPKRLDSPNNQNYL